MNKFEPQSRQTAEQQTLPEAIAGEILKVQPADPRALQLVEAALSAQGRATEALAAYRSAVGWLHGNLARTQTPFGLLVLQALGFRPKGILDIGAFEQVNLRNRLRSALMKMGARAVFQPRRTGQKSNARVNLGCALKTSRRCQRHAAPGFLQVHTGKIDGRSLAGPGALHRYAP